MFLALSGKVVTGNYHAFGVKKGTLLSRFQLYLCNKVKIEVELCVEMGSTIF